LNSFSFIERPIRAPGDMKENFSWNERLDSYYKLQMNF